MTLNGPPVFLERRSYRRRRLMDAARLLPILGAMLFLVPLVWPTAGDEAAIDDPVRTSVAMIFVFGVWAVLIVCTMVFSLFARRWRYTDSPQSQPTLQKSAARATSGHPMADTTLE